MLDSLHSRILATVVSIIVLTVAAMAVFMHRETVRTMSRIQNTNAENILNTVVLSVENEYNSLIFHKQTALEIRKNERRHMVSVVMTALNQLHQKVLTGEMSSARAREQAKEMVREMRYDQGVGYLWINDTTRPLPKMIMHPTLPHLNGKILNDPNFNCALGKKQNLFQAFVDVCLESGEGFVDYLWPKPIGGGLTKEQPKISYVALFRPWNWVVGTGVYIEDIEADAQKRRQAILGELRQTFSKVRTTKSGYLFIFNGNKEMLVHPALLGDAGQTLVNPASGKLILDDLMAAAKTPGQMIEYIWDKPPAHQGAYRFRKRAYMRYFPPLDWYIGSSVYVDEIQASSKMLEQKIIILALVALGLAILVSTLFARSLTTSLAQLMDHVRTMETTGIDRAGDIPETGAYETRALARVLNSMVGSVQKILSEKEILVEELKRARGHLEQRTEELVQSNQALKKREEEYLTLMRAVPDPIIVYGKTGKTLYVNPAFTRVFGWTCEDFQKRQPAFVPPQEGQRTREAIARVYRDGVIEGFHTQRMTLDGKVLDVSISCASFQDAQGRDKGVVANLRDITEWQKTQKAMIQNEKMMSLGGLAAGMAHEIKTPLAAMIQSAQLLENRLTGQFPANDTAAGNAGITMTALLHYLDERKVPRLISAVREGGLRVNTIIENMLSFSRKSRTDFQPCNLAQLLDNTLALAAQDYDLKKNYDFRAISVLRDYDPDLPEVWCEPSEIQQVVFNLLRNGGEAMHDAKIPAPAFHLTLTREKDQACIKIADNGPGIPPDTASQIFEPFFTTKDKGTGLGLSVSYFIIQNVHAGSMGVESLPGQGTTFKISLPFSRDKGPDQATG